MAGSKPYVITLGTAGGPRVWTPVDGSEPRCGIATALVVGDRWYLIDCGQGVYRQIIKSGLDINKLGGIFITHLHSDHTIDLSNVLLLGFSNFRAPLPSIPIYGPGDRGMLPLTSPRAEAEVTPCFPDNPTPGTKQLVDLTLRANATDVNDRVLDSLRPSPLDIWHGSDIELPADIGYHPNDSPFPKISPFEVHEDEHVRVTATLVEHPPIAPAFAFRFDTTSYSVTISGDTRYSENLSQLAMETDLLLHEAIDFEWVEVFNDINTPTGKAVIDHHRKSHSSPQDAGRVADESGARQLALHHLVPGTASPSVWEKAAENFSGPIIIPDDGAVIPLAHKTLHVPTQ